MVVVLLACNGDDGTTPPPPPTDTGTPPPTGDTGPTEVPPGPDLVLADAGYALTAAWTVASVDVRSDYDLNLRWQDVTTDAWGLPVAPAKVPKLVLLETIVDEADLGARLAADDLGADLLSVWEADVAGQVFANVEDLAYQATPFVADAYLHQDAGKTWVLGLANVDGARLDLRALKVIVPTDGSPTTSVDLLDGDSTFTWSAAFTGAPLVTSAGLAPDYTVDWSALPSDALGKEYDTDEGDVLFVGRFDEAPGALEGGMDDLQAQAEGFWTMDVLGDDSARLEFARDEGAATFPGFSTGSTWVVGVRCTTCFSPFPLWAAVVQVE